MAHSSAWRVNDAVAFDAMRERSQTLVSLLLDQATSESPGAGAAKAELATLQRDLHKIDGFDRRAVDGLAARITERISILSTRT